MKSRPLSTLALAALLPTILSCSGSEVVAPTAPPVDPTGTYSATEFITSADGVMEDQLANGVRFDITLAPDGSTTGTLFSPEAGGDPVDLTGTWTLQDDVVSFQQEADTFIRLTLFHIEGDLLRGERTFGNLSLRVTLTRQRADGAEGGRAW